MLVQGNVGRVKKLDVVVGESRRGLNITHRNHNSPVGNSPFSHTHDIGLDTDEEDQ